MQLHLAEPRPPASGMVDRGPDYPVPTQCPHSVSGLAGGLGAGELLRIMNVLEERPRESALSVEAHPMWSLISLIMAVC